MNRRRILRSAILTLVLLPTSCLAGVTASDRMDARIIARGGAQDPLWYENLLWLVALALMLVWAWAMKRLWEGAE
ncbi:hypothetical protein [Aurantiacibacter aquimixticola]|uniref:Uncharacterized protein n=1 Tax=Aurantiacibacter aquimixticola TaxID=1958945 RepID=A0A419RVL5_9SPHN|nr:hypothetical protein [Aurantiacibacter aquimixticola]RJY09819.1 hypothetical protein D6201_11040 [Aurantiacibacter aquimixticola]